jgi:adenylate cyclase
MWEATCSNTTSITGSSIGIGKISAIIFITTLTVAARNFNGKLKYLNFSGNRRFEIKPSQRGQKIISHPPQGVSEPEFAEFHGLRDLRVLGLMDVMTMFVSSLPDDTDDRRVRTSAKEVGGLGFGLADTLGRMDQIVMQDLVVPEFRLRKNESLFGMFGRAASICSNTFASKFLRDEFCPLFEKELDVITPHEGVGDALRRSFLKLNQRLYNDLLKGGSRKSSDASGTNTLTNHIPQKVSASGIVAYLSGKQLYVANVGDALAVLSRRGTAILVAKKHDPFDRSEIIRIRAAEGWVSPKGMVNDEFELSRSFGMFNLLPAVNARPEVHSETLTDGDEFVIIATRSIWDYVSYQTAVDIARVDRQNPMLAAQKLRDFAISYGADGSTMVMVLSVADLFERPKPAFEPRGPRWSKDGVDDKRLLRLTPEVPPPVGQVTLVFTDIRNSTHLWEVNPGMRTAMHLHNGLLRRLLRNIGGYEVKTEGDAFMVSFPSVFPAVLWCLSVQLQLLATDWPLEILESPDGKEIFDDNGTLLARGLSVRMGIHVGIPNCEPDPVTRRMDYFGPMVNRAARIQGSAKGGQIMCSAEVIQALREIVPMDKSDHPPQFDAMDPSTVHAIDEIRRIKYKLVHVGQRRMKGLELPQVVSLLYPRELFGRHALQQRIGDESTGSFGSQPQINLELINQLGLLCIRLEFLTSDRVFRSAAQQRADGTTNEDDEAESRVLYADPHLLLPSIPENATAAHLILVLDMLSVRISSALTGIGEERLSL